MSRSLPPAVAASCPPLSVPAALTCEVRLWPLHPEMGARIPWPQQMTAAAAGFDLAAALDAPLELAPGAFAAVPCGFAMELAPGYEAQIRPRSGLARKHGVTCLNAPGTIDADYRGEVSVLLINHGSEPFWVTGGMRIAQMVVASLLQVHLRVVPALSASARGADGFGSTGA